MYTEVIPQKYYSGTDVKTCSIVSTSLLQNEQVSLSTILIFFKDRILLVEVYVKLYIEATAHWSQL